MIININPKYSYGVNLGDSQFKFEKFLGFAVEVKHSSYHFRKTLLSLSLFLIYINFCFVFQLGLLTFATYTLMSGDNVLDANKAFVSIALFNILQVVLICIPPAFKCAAQVKHP